MSSQEAYVYFECKPNKKYIFSGRIKRIFANTPIGSISKGFKGSIPVPGSL